MKSFINLLDTTLHMPMRSSLNKNNEEEEEDLDVLSPEGTPRGPVPAEGMGGGATYIKATPSRLPIGSHTPTIETVRPQRVEVPDIRRSGNALGM